MQKMDKNASILIWTIFLSIIISMAFLGISTKIHKNIKNSGDFVANIENQTEIQNHLASGAISQKYVNKTFEDNIKIDFENQYAISRGLAQNSHSEFQFLDSGNTSVRIEILSGGPIQYFPTLSDPIISNSSTFNITGPTSLFIKNLGGNTHFTIESDKLILPPETKYTIYRKIGNLTTIQSEGVVKNFTAGDF